MTTREALHQLVDGIPESEVDEARKRLEPLSHHTADQPTVPLPRRRLGFLAGQITVPDDFDRMGEAEIHRLFGVES